MIEKTTTLDEVIEWINHQLSWRERLRMVERILNSIEQQFTISIETTKPLRSLYGLWRGFSVSEEDIPQARKEMWGAFARGDFNATHNC